jgi:hypothetical protein
MTSLQKLASGSSDDDFPVHKKRGHGLGPLILPPLHRDSPNNTSGIRIESDKSGVKQSDEHFSGAYGCATVRLPTADGQLR